MFFTEQSQQQTGKENLPEGTLTLRSIKHKNCFIQVHVILVCRNVIPPLNVHVAAVKLFTGTLSHKNILYMHESV